MTLWRYVGVAALVKAPLPVLSGREFPFVHSWPRHLNSSSMHSHHDRSATSNFTAMHGHHATGPNGTNICCMASRASSVLEVDCSSKHRSNPATQPMV